MSHPNKKTAMELIELGAGDHKYDTAIAKFTSTIQKHNNGIQLSSYNIAKVFNVFNKMNNFILICIQKLKKVFNVMLVIT